MTEVSSIVRKGLLDTSVFIAREAGRSMGELPEISAISVVTLAELHLGVLMAHGANVRALRLRTLTAVQNAFEPLPIDSDVARAFAELVSAARRLSRKPKIMNLWIAATAAAHDLVVYTQDQDFMSIPGIQVQTV
jgi:predicted nucleic acid-binding protein